MLVESGARAGDVYEDIGSQVQANFTSNQNTQYISEGDIVLVSGGYDKEEGKSGGLYQWTGSNGSRNLSDQDYAGNSDWLYVGSSYLSEQDYSDDSK